MKILPKTCVLIGLQSELLKACKPIGSKLVDEGPSRYTVGVQCGHTPKLLMAPTSVLRQDYASYIGTSDIICMLVTFYMTCDTLKAGNLSEQTGSEEKKSKEMFTLSSDHKGSLLRRQPGATDWINCTSQFWLAADAWAIHYIDNHSHHLRCCLTCTLQYWP